MATLMPIDFNALAESLASITLHLDKHIQQRAEEIAEPRVQAARDSAAARTAELTRDIAAWERRFNDVRDELRRQLDRQARQNERLRQEVAATRAAIRRVEALKVWTNEDGNGFVFAADLSAALAGQTGAGT